MTVTVATLYADAACEHYVAVIHGTVSEKDRQDLARRFDAEVWTKESEPEEDARVMYFREVETCDSVRDVEGMPNIDGISG